MLIIKEGMLTRMEPVTVEAATCRSVRNCSICWRQVSRFVERTGLLLPMVML